MPEMQRFLVTQTRTVTVNANSAADAGVLASLAFEYGQDANGHVTPNVGTPVDMWGNTTSAIQITDLDITKI